MTHGTCGSVSTKVIVLVVVERHCLFRQVAGCAGSTGPTLTGSPVPDLTTYQFVYNRMRRIQDSTVSATASNALNETDQGVQFTMDAPSRFLPALVAGLAYHVAMKKPEAAQRIQMLKDMYEEQYRLAADEDREKAPVRFVPDPGIY